ncbi:MAG: hypothetical protein QOE36_317 [Gaiellaceae bacterium]|nr:hypothetical protein [Gaiellaceae bacterium]
MNRRLLLTVDEGTGSLAAVRALRAAGWEPWIAPALPGTPSARSRAAAGIVEAPDPKSDPEGFATALAREASLLGVAAVLPGGEGPLRALTGREARFEGIPVGTAPAEALDRATDKAQLPELARRAGLESPPTAELRAGEDLPAEIGFPAVVKPLRSVSVAGGGLRTGKVSRVETAGELQRALAEAPGEPWLVQPYLTGTLSAIGGVAWEGELVSACHQVSPRIWPVGRGISSYAVTVPPDRAREDGVGRLLGLGGWSGVYGIQFLVAEGHSYVIDLNPRIYGSTALAVAAGHNLPAIWVELLLGRRPQVPPYRVGTRYRVEEDDVRALVSELRNGRWGAALGGLVPRRHTVHGIFSLRDPAPSLETLAKLRRRVRGR